jgi:preprotein translocase SecF subunit
VKTISFLKYRWYAITGSLIIIATFAVGTVWNGGMEWGIDFAGGVKVTAQFQGSINPGDIRKEFDKAGISAEVQQFGKEEHNQYIVTTKLIGGGETSEASSSAVKKVLLEKFPNVKIVGTETVGPAVGAFLKQSAWKLSLMALFLMALYLVFRFELKYSAGVMVAVLHDVMVAFLFCGFAGVEVNIPIIAAILTIFGFSVNDTIVIFDRVRENKNIKAKQTYMQLLDVSISETLSRTFITSLTVLFCVLALYVIGEGTISDFALVMLVGLVSGTYSTVYIASPIVIWWEKFQA